MSHPIPRWIRHAEHAIPRRRSIGPHVHRRCRDLLCVHRHRRPCNRLRARKRPLRHRGHRTRNSFVHVRDVRYIRRIDIRHLRVVNVCDHRVAHHRVAHVDAIHIPLAHVIRGHIHFARAEREPPNITAASAHRNRNAKSRSSDECHKCRRIHGSHSDWSRHPGPSAAERHPAAIVKWRVAPWRVINPRPAPR